MKRWLPVPGFEGLYKVSNQGRTRRLKSTTRIRGRAVKPVLNKRMLLVGLHRDGKTKYWQLHHLVIEVFVGAKPPGTKVAFRNGDTTDGRLENLYYHVTTKTYTKMPRQRVNDKLTAEDVKAIRASNARGTELAMQYGVSTALISRIRNGERR